MGFDDFDDDLRSSAIDDYDLDDDFEEESFGDEDDELELVADESAASGGFTPIERLILAVFGLLNVVAFIFIILLLTGRL